MALATLSIDIEAKLASFQESMDKAARIAEKNAAAVDASWKRAGATLAGIGASLAGAFAGVSFVDFVRSNADAIDALNDVADATGSTIENISALEDLANRTGTTMDTVTGALVKLNGQLSDAKPDSGASQALKAIGLEAEKLRALDPAEALRQVAVALSGFADDGNKARLVQELFGKSVREVAPLLKDLADNGELVAKVTTEQAAAAERFNRQLADFQTNVQATRREIVSGLLPSFSRLLDELRTGVEVFGSFNAAVLSLGTSNLSKPIAERREQIEAMTQSLRALQEEAAKPGFFFSERSNSQAQEKLKALIAEQEKLITYSQRIQALSVPLADYSNEGRLPGAGGRPTVGPLGGGGEERKKQAEQITAAQRALSSYVTELQREAEKLSDVSQQQKLLNLLRAAGADQNPVGPGLQEYVEKLQQQITLAKQDNAIRADNLRIEREMAAMQKSLNDELDRLSGRAEKARRQELLAALDARQAGDQPFSEEEAAEIRKRLSDAKEEAKNAFAEMDELTKQFGRNVQDALGDTVLATLKGDFDNILSLWGDLLIKMAAQALAADIGKSLFGNLFGGSGAGAGQLGGVFGEVIDAYFGKFSLANGGVVDRSGITQFATGGVFDKSTLFSYAGGRLGELGEAGPEAVMPLRRGRDGKLGVAAAGSAGPTVVVNIAAGVTRPELAALVPQLTAQIKAEVQASARRPGGF